MSSPTPEDEPTLSPLFHKGDVILRSFDGMDLWAYKIDLSRASPFFETMFSLPQPSPTSPGTVTEHGIAVVAVTESAEVLTKLLALCMPMCDYAVHLKGLGDVVLVLEAAKKYEMEWLVARGKDMLKALAEKACFSADDIPLRVYAVACHFGLQEEAEVAARCCLRVPMQTILSCEAEELHLLSGMQFRRLMTYRNQCQNVVSSYLSTVINDVCAHYAIVSCRHGRPHTSNWRSRYHSQLCSALTDCIWEGAVRLEHGFAAHINLVAPGEMCPNQYCLVINQGQITSLHEKVVADVKTEIAKVTLVF